nr:E3 ubiquitin-protein ligase SPL2-like [Ipomoea batatas]
MSAPDQAVAAVLSQIALAADGTVLGLALAFIAVRSVLKFKATNSALHQIKEAPSVRVSDLRSVVSEHGDSNQSDDGKLVIVRGTVEARSAVEGDWKSLRSDILVAHDSG